MTNFLIYKQISELLLDKLTTAELRIYNAVTNLACTVKSSIVYATIDYFINKKIYKSKSFISKTLARLVDKGLLRRTLVQSNQSIHKVYQYYVVPDLKLTKIFKELSPEEQQKYLVIVKDTDKPCNVLTPEENRLYTYLKYQIGISDLTHNKLMILLDCAKENNAIVPGTEINIIVLMSKHCMSNDVKNPFGYLKRIIINYSTEPKSSYVPADKEVDSETVTEECMEVHKACDRMNIRLSIKQIKAILYVANRLKIDVARVINIIDKCRYIKKIKDIFLYILKCLYNADKEDSAVNEQSYDIKEFENFAITFSGNIKGNTIEPEPESKRKSQSYDWIDFEKLAVTFSKNTK